MHKCPDCGEDCNCKGLFFCFHYLLCKTDKKMTELTPKTRDAELPDAPAEAVAGQVDKQP
jgi:hypothetical protein